MKERTKSHKRFCTFFPLLLTNGKNTSLFQITENIFLQMKTKLSFSFLQEAYTGGSKLFQHSTHKLKFIYYGTATFLLSW